MKTRYKIIYILMLSTNIYFGFKFNSLKKEAKYINKQIKENGVLYTLYQNQTTNYICELEHDIKQRDTMLLKLYKPIVRMQLIAGIKEPDTTFTYLEKVMNPVDIKALIKHDFRKK